MRRTRYRFLHRAGGRYWWESVRPVGARDSRYEVVSCPVAWFWRPRSDAARQAEGRGLRLCRITID